MSGLDISHRAAKPQRMMGLWSAAVAVALALPTQAADVLLTERTAAGGVTNVIRETVAGTGTNVVSSIAPAIADYLFTHWTLSTSQSYSQRDIDGRAYDALPLSLFEDTVLTAHYLLASEDRDGDGIADGLEWYWYNGLANSPGIDTDGDGYGFAQELQAGINPLLKDSHTNGGVVWDGSDVVQYNPGKLPPYTIRSDPEGSLFGTITDYALFGAMVSTPACDASTTAFAYWTQDGVPVRDADGRALDHVTFAMPGKATELVAHTVENETERLFLYWFGNAEGDMSGDRDGDGYTFAEEMEAGNNPLLKDSHTNGGVVWDDSGLVDYNPHNMMEYVIRSEPEGALFETIRGHAKPGAIVTTPAGDRYGAKFAYWTQDGAVLRDADGRALDKVEFAMPNRITELVAHTVEDETVRMKQYWYGAAAVDMKGDTDSDGYTFEAELAAGLNPHLADSHTNGGVVWDESNLVEVNLQPFEQMLGAVVDGVFEQLFTSPIAGNGGSSMTFGNGSQIWPVVADVNGDKVWDLIVCSATATNVYLNVGTSGNPEFTVGSSDLASNAADLMMNSIAKLSALSLDVTPLNALSATTNGTTLLISDVDGRIWYYQGLGDSGQGAGVSNSSTPTLLHSLTYTLQHKVWGGSHPGFAEGLMLAAVDWDDDGDLDCLCGTADGKLMLLRDPKVGRPTNVKALSGVDNVLLTWDPNVQSRIRGYKVYRAEADSSEFANISQPQLPAYRDFPGESGSYDYKVSSVSRFYTAGNSTPTITESPATEAVRATLGTVRFFWNDVVCKLGENANVMLSIENSLNYDVSGKTQTVAYDPAYLRPVKAAPSGLAENVKFSESHADGVWTINLESGTLAAGGGKFFTLVFETLKEGKTTVGEAKVSIMAADPSKPTEVPPYSLGDVTGDGKIDEADVRELAKLKNGTGRKYTANQLKAGDFNGNGKLDDADYQALRELLKEKGVL